LGYSELVGGWHRLECYLPVHMIGKNESRSQESEMGKLCTWLDWP
jgi:hypothetical protein